MLSAEEYVRRVVAELQSVRSGCLTAVERTAEAMARRVLQGGKLYIVDDHSGLTSEAVGRAGGLMMIQPLTTTDLGEAGIAAPDILIMCSRRAENASMSILARDARQRGVYVVALCPSVEGSDTLRLTHWASAHLPVPLDEGVFTTSDGQEVCPISGVVACAMLWILTAAFIERMHLHDKTPHLWRSIKLPDSRSFNEQAMSDTLREGY
ncbi:MAG: DUF2529 family protein [Chthonomonadetes bacterium]|nr:DUF2529 family protein [Chthonomonadetes bacterium]